MTADVPRSYEFTINSTRSCRNHNPNPAMSERNSHFPVFLVNFGTNHSHRKKMPIADGSSLISGLTIIRFVKAFLSELHNEQRD